MDGPQSDLWRRLQEFDIDPGDARLLFSDRLARENGWSRPFARRVVEEYKRFVFLAMVAGHSVTPSDEVDEAWHLHLTYTQSYWDGLCRGVLAKPLHHVPTRGGPAEHARHVDQYNRTLASYEKWFGESPPPDIWPPADVRFGNNKGHVRVDRDRVWITPKPRWPRGKSSRTSLAAGALAAPLFVGVANPFDLTGPEFLLFYGCIGAVAIAAAIGLRRFFRNNDMVSEDAPLSPYDVACLGGGVPGVLRACLATLIVDKRLQVCSDVVAAAIRKIKGNPQTYKAEPPLTANHDIERIMLQHASHPNGATAAELLDAARPVAEEIELGLQRRGLMESDESFFAARWGPLLLLAVVWLMGAAKIVVGIDRDKPVIFLMVGVFALSVVMLFILRRPLRTLRGEARLHELKDQYARLESLRLEPLGAATLAPIASNDLLLAAGLFGLASLNHPDVTTLNKSLKPISTSNSSGSGCGAATSCGGGGDGGGGGGGGCGGGGCGGCGGG